MDPWTQVHATLAFFALMMAIISFWINKSTWIWGGFLILAISLAFFAQLIKPIALAPIGALFILHGILRTGVDGLARLLLVLMAIAISIGLWVHFFPGFKPVVLADKVSLGPHSSPFTLSMQFDKPFVGFFILAFSLPLIQNLGAFRQLLKTAIPLTLVGMAILAGLSLYTGMIAWEPKFPNLFWLFAPINLLFAAIPEEAFMRGFVQRETFKFMGGGGALAQVFSVLLTALFFAVLHWGWASSIPFLGLVFVAGVIYGTIYQITQSIEASILCHFLFNIAHFTLFTYPSLSH